MKKKLTKGQKEGVRNWLDKKDYVRCPFDSPKDCHICESWFPKTKGTPYHPCDDYSLTTVIRLAKEMVKP